MTKEASKPQGRIPRRGWAARLAGALLDAAAVVSLVLLVAVVWVWVESYWTGRYISIRMEALDMVEGECLLLVDSGRLAICDHDFGWKRHWPARGPSGVVITRFPPGLYLLPSQPGKDGFSLGHIIVVIDNYPHPPFIIVALWLLALLLVPLPLWRAWQWRRRRRARWKDHCQRLGLCLRCGYDLRASPERCPECGAAK